MDSFGFLSRAQHLSQQETQGSMRTGTPTLPPGLPMPHAHPTTSTLQSPPGLSSPVPSFPPGLNPPFSRIGTPTHQARGLQSPELKDASDNAPPSNRVRDGSQISLGSPLPKSANKSRGQSKNDLAPIGDGKRDFSSASLKMKPLKLETSLDNAAQATEVSPRMETGGNGQALSFALGSRPNTPLTTMSRTSESPAPRQPRVLRVVDNTPKNETPPPASASQSISSNPLVPKTRSRRPSISSFSRPDSPGDGGSDGEQYTSASVSRANSPPASSRIGSAPVRSMTKSQAKKERRQKAKDAEAKKHETTTVAEEPVQAPIVGRKRKTKKASAKNNAEPSSATVETAPESVLSAKTGNDAPAPTAAPATATAPAPAPVPAAAAAAAATDASATSNSVEEKAEPTKKTKAQEKAPTKETKPSPVDPKSLTVEFEPAEEAWRTKNTVEQMLKDAETGETLVKDLFSERTPPLQTLLGELHKSGALDLNKHPLFNPTNLAQRFDMKCGSEDYEGLKQPIELTEDDRKTLLRGEPVRINGDSNLLKDRCLISPRGCVLHHLSPEEEERYLALEKSISWTVDSFQEYPSVPITEPDMTNRGGGLDALFATPENFNVCWIDDAATTGLSSTAASLAGGDDLAATTTGSAGRVSVTPPNVLSAMEADSTRSHNWAIANTADLVNATAASVRSFAAATAKHMLGAAGVVMGNIPDLDDVVGMTDEELRSFAIKSQKDLEVSRKDLDSIDKKLNALVKRNKKLAQQALAN